MSICLMRRRVEELRGGAGFGKGRPRLLHPPDFRQLPGLRKQSPGCNVERRGRQAPESLRGSPRELSEGETISVPRTGQVMSVLGNRDL